jgi:hypothetical protein
MNSTRAIQVWEVLYIIQAQVPAPKEVMRRELGTEVRQAVIVHVENVLLGIGGERQEDVEAFYVVRQGKDVFGDMQNLKVFEHPFRGAQAVVIESTLKNSVSSHFAQSQVEKRAIEEVG